MGSLYGLGLGGIFSSCPPEYLPSAYKQWQQYIQAQAQQNYQPIFPCMHGIDCPICLENTKKREEEIKKIAELKAQKTLEYKIDVRFIWINSG